ncbi:nucleoside phosphorylase [Waterburya agarophytonicola K14]|uniref:Uridine phosphorylase n=1 Tax=Waterburya agarophytonicola KI4 TaxID=2874699 RepID=A0A964BPT0_9CYAN|nr:nucleoside phosphorylase [Waterburya agarophytonicola]MCC0176617.1 nucleoside phosphorylase [Waterburya agarophytonicola KI4]
MKLYHIGFSKSDFGVDPPDTVLLSGEPERSQYIARTYLQNVKLLSKYRGLDSYLGNLPCGKPILVATSGMGASSLSIVVNELVQVGIKRFIRIGTCGSIQPNVGVGSIVVSQAALTRQGAALDIAPPEYPAVADPYLTVALVETARKLKIPCHLGITASVDTFYEGQERTESSANTHLQPWLKGITASYRQLNILNYEMEAGTLLKMAGVYGFAAACVCAVVAQRTVSETIVIADKDDTVNKAIKVAVKSIS